MKKDLKKDIAELEEIMAKKFEHKDLESKSLLDFINEKKGMEVPLLSHLIQFFSLTENNGKIITGKYMTEMEWRSISLEIRSSFLAFQNTVIKANPEPDALAEMLWAEIKKLGKEQRIAFLGHFLTMPQSLVPYRRIPDYAVRMEEAEFDERMKRLGPVLKEIDVIKKSKMYNKKTAMFSVILKMINELPDERDRAVAMAMVIDDTPSVTIGILGSLGGLLGELGDILGKTPLERKPSRDLDVPENPFHDMGDMFTRNSGLSDDHKCGECPVVESCPLPKAIEFRSNRLETDMSELDEFGDRSKDGPF
jgi:hypothetical protein